MVNSDRKSLIFSIKGKLIDDAANERSLYKVIVEKLNDV